MPKNKIQMLVIGLLLGVFLLVAGNLFRTAENTMPVYIPSIIHREAEQNTDCLAEQMEDILGRIAGAGRVSVMVFWSEGHELVFAQNITESYSKTIEADGQDGERTIDNRSRQNQHVTMRQSDGSEAPLVIREIGPRIEGVIIVAQGGGDAAVREALTRAAQTVLGVRPHQVQVFQGN